jgi:hypothetical protein
VWAVARRILAGRPVRWGFAAAAVAIGGYAVASEWTHVWAALARLAASCRELIIDMAGSQLNAATSVRSRARSRP